MDITNLQGDMQLITVATKADKTKKKRYDYTGTCKWWYDDRLNHLETGMLEMECETLRYRERVAQEMT